MRSIRPGGFRGFWSRSVVGLTVAGLVAAILGLASPAPAQTAKIYVTQPTRGGNVTIKLWYHADPHGLHGVPSATTVFIPATATPVQKANLIANAILANPQNLGIVATVMGGTPTLARIDLSDPTSYGVACVGVVDGTGQEIRFSNESQPPEPVQGWAKLVGQPSPGAADGYFATLGENGVSHTVLTTGKTLPQIYEEWWAAFGGGTATSTGFWLPPTSGPNYSFSAQVSDPNLEVAVEVFFGVPQIPTLSIWGIAVMVLLLATAALTGFAGKRNRLGRRWSASKA